MQVRASGTALAMMASSVGRFQNRIEKNRSATIWTEMLGITYQSTMLAICDILAIALGSLGCKAGPGRTASR